MHDEVRTVLGMRTAAGLWALNHRDEIAVVNAGYLTSREGCDSVRGRPVHNGHADTAPVLRAVLSVVDLGLGLQHPSCGADAAGLQPRFRA